MSEGRTSTYVTYNEGLEAKHLHLGNLVHDYKDPNSLDPYVEKAYADIAEPPPAWAKATALENFALTLGNNNIEGSKDEPRYRVAAAEKASKLEIKDPEKFFNEITLASTEAKQWLASRLSAAEILAHSKGNTHARPQVWMLTGLVLMTHATWTVLSSGSGNFQTGFPAPFTPKNISELRRLSVSEGVRPTFGFRAADTGTKEVAGSVICETGKYPGTRGWAARWQKVDVEIVPAEKANDGVQNQLRLKSKSGPAKVAVVELDEDVYAEPSDRPFESTDKDDEEEYWDELLDTAEGLHGASRSNGE